VVLATVVNHRKPHKGDRSLFFDAGNHESTCKPCHDGPIQSEERRGFARDIGADGWPTDPRHAANRTR
jgi:5-methylcytosine-specific restriction protein A